MYSDMSMRSTARSSSKSSAASVRASSVLPTPVGPRNRNEPIGTVGIAEARARAPDGVGDGLDGLVLADHALVQAPFERDELLHLALEQARDGDARPGGDDLGDVVGRDLLVEQALAAVRLERGLLVLELACELGQAPVAQLGGALQVAVALRALGLLAGLLDLRLGVLDRGDAGLLGLPALGQHGQLGAHALELAGERRAALLGGGVGLARERGVLDLELLRPALQHVQLVRHRVDLDAQPAGGLVDQVDRLVGQEAVGDVALGELGRRDQRGVHDAHAVVHLVALAQAAQDRDRVGHGGLAHEHRREAPLERGVLLDVLAVLVERGRADRAQLTAGEHGLEQVGRVDRALRRARADDRVQLVDEEDDAAVGRGDLLEHGLEALLELAAVLRAGQQRPQVERPDAAALEALGHVARDDALRQALDNRRLANARLPDQDRVVLGAP